MKGDEDKSAQPKPPTNIIGNIGLFYVCYELSRRGYNVVPTSRNTKAVDVIVGTADFKRHATVQVKTMTIDIEVFFAKKEKAPTLEDALAIASLADIWVHVRVDAEQGHSIKRVTVWRGNDQKLVTERANRWSFNPQNFPRQTPDEIKQQWANQQDEGGWKVIDDFLRCAQV